MMEALRWTEKAPIELGYYWVSTKTGFSAAWRQTEPDETYEAGQYGVEIVEVFEDEDGKRYVKFCGWDIPSPFEMVAKNSYFAGPIPEPRGIEDD